jgi:hypothetical protein
LTSLKRSAIITKLSEKFRECGGEKKFELPGKIKRPKRVLTNFSGFDKISNATVKN